MLKNNVKLVINLVSVNNKLKIKFITNRIRCLWLLNVQANISILIYNYFKASNSKTYTFVSNDKPMYKPISYI